MAKKDEGQWLVQMHVFPDEAGEGSGDFEHDYPYAVEYNPGTGDRRTVRLSQDEVEAVRAANGFPAEEIRSANEE